LSEEEYISIGEAVAAGMVLTTVPSADKMEISVPVEVVSTAAICPFGSQAASVLPRA
jgi:hypothetical protein